MDRHRQTFIEEATELLGDLEATLLELEESPADPELVGRAFRSLHTIKGSGAMVGFDEVAALTHEVENFFELARDGKAEIDKRVIALTLSTCDQIREMIQAEGDTEDQALHAVTSEIIDAFKRLVSESGGAVPAKINPDRTEAADGKSDKGALAETASYRISFKPKPHFFQIGANPLLILEELRGLGECAIVAQTGAIPTIDKLDPENCFTWWDIVLTTDQGPNAIRDVFIFVEDECDIAIKEIEDAADISDGANYKRLGEILIDRGLVTEEQLQKALGDHKRIGERLVESGAVDRDQVNSALAEQEHIQKLRRDRQMADRVSSVRVPAKKLDDMVDLVGELVTAQARLTQMVLREQNTELLEIAEEFERLTAELRDKTMSIRTLPIGTIFSGFKRLVRDLSEELRKQVKLSTKGAETELDKTVIERLNDPLVHLIRNAIDHGIESPETREAAGKPVEGTVHLEAIPSGAHVLIKISDDGAGLDLERIRARAVRQGLIASEAELSENDLYSLIFAPGFSTAENVTSVSGRGVGMDVVKKSIEALRGSIEVESARGAGTIIVLKLPLTLAIIEGLLVNIGANAFVLPLATVEECVELAASDAALTERRRMVNIRGEAVPYIRLREFFSIRGASPEIEQIVVARVDGHKVGFVVDEVIGDHQTVIKTLGKLFDDITDVSGATILGDGSVALILDVPKLLKNIEHEYRVQIGADSYGSKGATIH